MAWYKKRKVAASATTSRGAALWMVILIAVASKVSAKEVHYQQVDLVSDQADVALLQDPNLVNAWGMSFSPTGPFWVSANETGLSTLYTVTNDASGDVQVTKVPLEVSIPGEGVTGQFFDPGTNFNGDLFVFVTEDGTISGWRSDLGSDAEVLTTREGASYKGVTLAKTSSGPLLLAANFAEATVDVYDTNMTLVAQYSDTNAPDGYAPFNVQSAKGLIFVTYAKVGNDGDDEKGPGNGLIDILNPVTGRFRRLATGSDAGGKLDAINSPWGITVAPRNFGKHSGELLVGNFGSGTIMAFRLNGKFRGLLKADTGGPVEIDGLWALAFRKVPGSNRQFLYFTAGPDEEAHGLFGRLEPAR